MDGGHTFINSENGRITINAWLPWNTLALLIGFGIGIIIMAALVGAFFAYRNFRAQKSLSGKVSTSTKWERGRWKTPAKRECSHSSCANSDSAAFVGVSTARLSRSGVRNAGGAVDRMAFPPSPSPLPPHQSRAAIPKE